MKKAQIDFPKAMKNKSARHNKTMLIYNSILSAIQPEISTDIPLLTIMRNSGEWVRERERDGQRNDNDADKENLLSIPPAW